MARARLGAGLMASCLLVWTGATSAWAAPTVAQMLSFRPKQEGVVISTPTAQELESCKVELVNGARAGSSGWLLRDSAGKPLRRFFDTNGDKKIDVWSYYENGIEVYREVDTNFNDKADQYRWLHTGGSKWGVDANEDGKIDGWKIISAEEATQEILQAVVKNDYARLQALMLTEAEIKALELPAAEANRIRDVQKKAQAKFQAAAAKLASAGSEVRWLHLETSAPQCQPADVTGMKQDLIKHARGTVIYEANGKADSLQTGEMILVGLAWRIIDAPVAGPATESADKPGESEISAELQPLLEELRKHDEKAPKMVETSGPNPEMVRYSVARADILERIAAKDKADKRDQWLRQVADALATAAQSSAKGDKSAYERLLKLSESLVKTQAGSLLAAYVTFREMSADYASKQGDATPDQFSKVQEARLDRLKKFVQDFPKGEDTPDALLELGMVSELMGKDAEAKKWYEQIIKNFPNHTLASKAGGAIKRIESDGKAFELTGPVLGSGSSFSVSQHKNKVVVVYYWASWNQQSVGDFAKLKLMLTTYGSKGLELVCVNLDATAAEANDFLKKSPAPGTHLFQEGGLDSPLAKQYGIAVLPSLFLVNKEGKVVSHTVQMSNLEDEIKKLLN